MGRQAYLNRLALVSATLCSAHSSLLILILIRGFGSLSMFGGTWNLGHILFLEVYSETGCLQADGLYQSRPYQSYAGVLDAIPLPGHIYSDRSCTDLLPRGALHMNFLRQLPWTLRIRSGGGRVSMRMIICSSMMLGVIQSTQNPKLLPGNYEGPRMTFSLPWELSSVARIAM